MNFDEMVDAENESIRAFLLRHSGLLTGKVLDYGCGRQPYRELIEEAGGLYTGYDRAYFPVNRGGDFGNDPLNVIQWDTIVCTQVVQFVENYHSLIRAMRLALKPGGALLLTFPTCWPEINDEDLHRFTSRGMHRLLTKSGFDVSTVELRDAWRLDGVVLPFGYGAVALA